MIDIRSQCGISLLSANEPLAQLPHPQAILARYMPKVTEEGYNPLRLTTLFDF